MAVATHNQLANVDPVFLRPTSRCFYCGQSLAGSLWIYWNGSDEKGQQIWLHAACARRLADHLIKDHAHAGRNTE